MSSQGSLGFTSAPRSTTEHLRQSPRLDQPAVVASKKKKKQKQKQVPDKRPDTLPSPNQSESGPSTKPQSPAPSPFKTPIEPKTQSAAEQQHAPRDVESPHVQEALASPWADSQQEDDFDNNFRVGDEDEFKNVWGGGEPR